MVIIVNFVKSVENLWEDVNDRMKCNICKKQLTFFSYIKHKLSMHTCLEYIESNRDKWNDPWLKLYEELEKKRIKEQSLQKEKKDWTKGWE